MRVRCTLVAGESFSQDYLFQLPKKILFPIIAYSVLTHWMLGEALQTQEATWLEDIDGRHFEHSNYIVSQYKPMLLCVTDACRLLTQHTHSG
jgi:hypothetical protein